jgi:hypothetical protein
MSKQFLRRQNHTKKMELKVNGFPRLSRKIQMESFFFLHKMDLFFMLISFQKYLVNQKYIKIFKCI